MGESLPAKKGPGDVVFGGSTINQGERHAVVYATGPNTFFGRSAALISGVHNVPNIQKVRLSLLTCAQILVHHKPEHCKISNSDAWVLQIMTKIGACCLVTIGIWVIIELAVQFGKYHHHCHIGEGKLTLC